MQTAPIKTTDEIPVFLFNGKPLNNRKVMKPPKMIIYGANGVGKSHAAAWANCCIFIDAEGNLDHLPHDDMGDNPIFSKERVMSFHEIENLVQILLRTEHPFKTVVIDSLDTVYALCMEEIKSEFNYKELAYGADHKICSQRLTTLCKNLDALREQKKMTIILLAHAKLRTVDNPLVDKYDRWETTLNESVFRTFMDWSTCILLAISEFSSKEQKPNAKKSGRINTEGVKRWFYTSNNAACFAKNTYSLPEKIPMDNRTDWYAMMEMMRKSFERAKEEIEK